LIRVVAAATVGGLAGIAAAISYSHMRQLAQDHGQARWHAHAFPLSVDGIKIVASLVLLADRRAGRRAGWLPWAALAVGTAGSMAANVATASPAMISRLIAGWPALALLIAVKLLSGMLDQRAASSPAMILVSKARHHDQPASAASSVRPGLPGSARPRIAAAVPRKARAGRGASPTTGTQPGTVRSVPADVSLLAAARAASGAMQRDGRRLTRDALATVLRENGYPVSNSRLTSLLRTLRSELSSPSARPRRIRNVAPGAAAD
jgi:hypothetical protein